MAENEDEGLDAVTVFPGSNGYLQSNLGCRTKWNFAPSMAVRAVGRVEKSSLLEVHCFVWNSSLHPTPRATSIVQGTSSGILSYLLKVTASQDTFISGMATDGHLSTCETQVCQLAVFTRCTIRLNVRNHK